VNAGQLSRNRFSDTEIGMKQILIQGAHWAYREQGAGRPIVLVHGFPLDHRLWSAVAADLATSCRVVSIDLPGFGQSTLGPGFTIESLGDGVAALAKSLQLGPFVAAGLSMGGYIVQALASRHADALSGLVLLDTKSDADTPQQKHGRDAMIELARESGSKAVADEMLGKLLSPQTIRTSPQVVRELRAMMEAVPPKTIETALAAMRDRREYTRQLPTLSMPLQLIVGEDDALATPSLMQTMQQAAPGSKLAIIPGAGHVPPLEQPQLTADAFRAFLA
jgi:pimeloyl-ACP methyl ester carboxylesterase